MTSAESDGPDPRWLPAIGGLVAFVIYVLTAAPTAFWLDSSELVAGAYELGISHPPAHPLFIVLGKLATLVPVGSIAFRVHILCGALTGLGVSLAVAMAQRFWPDGYRWPVVPVAAALAVTTPFWFHGVRAEVYPLHLVLGALIVMLAVRAAEDGGPAEVAGLGLLTGLALANHHYLVTLMAPGVLLILLHTRPGRRALWRGLPLASLGLLSGLMTYALLPIRAAAMTTVHWGAPDSPGGFWWVLTARAFQKTAGEGVSRIDVEGATQHIGQLVGAEIGWILPALALVGLVLLARRRLGLAAGIALLVAGNLLSQILFDFDPTNPDVGGYFMLSVWLVAVLAVGPLATAVHAVRRLSRPTRLVVKVAAVAVPLLAASIVLPRSFARSELSDLRDSEMFADEVYAFAPTDALVVTAYFETIFNLWYREVAECRRPDVAVVHRLFRTYPGYDEWLIARYPDMVGMLAVDPRSGQLDPDWLSRQSAERAVLIEADPTVPDWIRARVLPAGVLMQIAPMALPTGPWPASLNDADRTFWQHFYDRVDTSQRETAGNLLWVAVNQMMVFGGQGREEAASERFARSWELAPGDPDLARMAREVGLSANDAQSE